MFSPGPCAAATQPQRQRKLHPNPSGMEGGKQLPPGTSCSWGLGAECRPWAGPSRIPELPHPSLGSQLDPGSSLRAVYPMHSSALREGFTQEPHSKTSSECRGAARPWQRVPSPLLHPVLGPRRQSLAAGLPPDIPPLPQPPRCPSCRTAGRPSARTAGWTSASWRWAARTRAGSRSSGKAEA